MKRSLILGGALLVGLFSGYFLAYGRMDARHVRIAPGDTLIGRPAEEVLLLSYTTLAMTLTAQRSKPGVPFAVQVTFADGRPVQRCTGSANLAGQLSNFSHLIAKREISLHQRDAEFPLQLGTLDIRDRGIGDPESPMLVFTSKDRKSVAVIFNGYAAELTIPPSAFKTLVEGCDAIGK